MNINITRKQVVVTILLLSLCAAGEYAGLMYVFGTSGYMIQPSPWLTSPFSDATYTIGRYNSTHYFGQNCTGFGYAALEGYEFLSTNASTILNAAVDALSTTQGGTIFIDDPINFTAPITIANQNSVTIYSNKANIRGSSVMDSNVMPTIMTLTLTASSQNIKGFKFQGLSFREVEMDAQSSYNIVYTSFEDCAFQPKGSGTGASNRGVLVHGTGYTYFLHFTRCVFHNSWQDTIPSAPHGAITLNSTNSGNGQIYVTDCDYKPAVANATFFGGIGRMILTKIVGMSFVTFQEYSKLFHMGPHADFTDIKVMESLFECHNDTDIFAIEDGTNSADMYFFADFSHNTFSLTHGQPTRLIVNLASQADWTENTNGIWASHNHIKTHADDFSLGISGAVSSFEIYLRDWDNWKLEAWGTSTTAYNGQTISHTLVGTPTYVFVTSGNATETIECGASNLGSSTFTVRLHDDEGAAVTGQTIYWYAVYYPT